jgi:predicted DNA-binding protein with PD1-like motif
MELFSFREYQAQPASMARIWPGADLQDALNQIAVQMKLNAGQISGIGAVRPAVIGFYNFETKVYERILLNDYHELVNLNGNISLRDGKPFVHTHIVVGNRRGEAFGGHLMPGTKVMVAELTITPFKGVPLIRRVEEDTGLPLWNFK